MIEEPTYLQYYNPKKLDGKRLPHFCVLHMPYRIELKQKIEKWRVQETIG